MLPPRARLVATGLMAAGFMMAEFATTRTGAAQSATAQQFEVVSIKPNQNAAGPMGAIELPGRRLPFPPP